MEVAEKIKEIEILIMGLRKLGEYLYTPIQRFRKMREELDSSVDLLKGLQKRIKRAEKKGLGLTAEIAVAASAETTDFEMMDKFFEQLIRLLDKTKQEVEERWQRVKDLRQKTGSVNVAK